MAFVSVGDADDIHFWSGIPFHMLQALRKSNIRVELISPLRRTFRYRYSVHKLLNRNFHIDRESIALRSYRDQIQEALDRVDVDLIFSAGSSIPVAGLDSKHQPVIFWTDAVYNSMPSYYPGFDAHTTNARNALVQERNSLKNATVAVYSSEWAAMEGRKYYPEYAHKIRVVPFGANLTQAPPRMERPSPKPCTLLFVGVDWERKGGDIALETARLLNRMCIPTKLKIVGCRPPVELPPFAESLGFISKSNERGRKALQALFEEASFFLFPTRAECSAIVFCEAAAYSLPVISTWTGGVGTYVKEGVNGNLLPIDAPPRAYAELIRRIIVDQTGVYRRLCCGARREYEERLNWETGVRECLSLV